MKISELDQKRLDQYETLIHYIRVYLCKPIMSEFGVRLLEQQCEKAEKLGITDSDNILRIAKQLRNYIKGEVNASKDQKS